MEANLNKHCVCCTVVIVSFVRVISHGVQMFHLFAKNESTFCIQYTCPKSLSIISTLNPHLRSVACQFFQLEFFSSFAPRVKWPLVDRLLLQNSTMLGARVHHY